MTSALGPHSQLATSEALAWAKVAPGVKGVDCVPLLRASPPGRLKVHRHYWGTQSLTQNPSDAADQAIQSLGGYNDPDLYLEGFNETNQSFNSNLAGLIDWYSGFSARCELRGYHSCGPGFSVGNPPDGDGGTAEDAWRLIQGKNFGGCSLLLINQYFGSFSPDPAISGEQALSTVLRHRLIHLWTSGNHPPFALGETGYDAVNLPGAPVAYSGFRLRPGYYEGQYLADLRTLDALLQEDAKIGVICGFVFGSGPVLPQWKEFNVDPMHLENDFNGPSALEQWQWSQEPLEDGVTIEEIANKPQRDDPTHTYGIWGHVGIKGTKGGIRAAFADTPDWQTLLEIGGEAVVIDSHGIYRPNA